MGEGTVHIRRLTIRLRGEAAEADALGRAIAQAVAGAVTAPRDRTLDAVTVRVHEGAGLPARAAGAVARATGGKV